jgi:serine/threonine-protein kinase HipA
MGKECTIQLFVDGRWHEVASVSLVGPPTRGHQAATLTGYAVDWALAHDGARDAWALSSQAPVSFEPVDLPHWPVFLIDMLPQGFGRQELLRQLNLSERAEAEADWPLLIGGAGNPIGHLRVKEAADWLGTRTGPRRGFAEEEVAARSADFMEYLGAHGLFVAGSSGVQGEWPKVLLTRARDGLLYLDHTLTDDEGVEYFIVKFGRGSNERLAQILRQEAPYMALATHLGLRVNAPLVLREQALFIPRFDRRITNGALVRLAQESLATLVGQAGFGVTPSHETVCEKLVAVCSDPQMEILEYLRRDVANLALANKDNHARNTALQRTFDGCIALAPLYDFAPMYLHPDGIARRMRWAVGDGSAPDWSRVLDAVCASGAIARPPLVIGLRAMVPRLREIAADGGDFGLEADVLSFVKPYLLAQAAALEELT